MKLLLDECLPIDLRFLLTGHDVETVEYRGWKGVKNGKLLATAAPEGFEALITSDEGMEHSQNPATVPMAVVILHVKSNDLMDIRPLVPRLLQRLSGGITKSFIHIS
jgi:predicted nuclease of predicted toxin-antitoxin system